MKNNFDLELKKALTAKTSVLSTSEEGLELIFANLETYKKKKVVEFKLKKYSALIACILLITIGTPFIFSANVRVTAVDAIKTVFVLDKNSNIIEVPAKEVFMTPANSKSTILSDEKLSEKLGVKFSFPNTLVDGYVLTNKSEAVGLASPINYTTYSKIQSKAVMAIDDNSMYKSLKRYKPFRSVGATYKSETGDVINIAVFNKPISVYLENIKINQKTKATINGSQAIWLSLSYPNYNGDNMASKPTELATSKLLIWNKNGATFVLLPNDPTSSIDSAIEAAEAFVKLQ